MALAVTRLARRPVVPPVLEPVEMPRNLRAAVPQLVEVLPARPLMVDPVPQPVEVLPARPSMVDPVLRPVEVLPAHPSMVVAMPQDLLSTRTHMRAREIMESGIPRKYH